MKVTSPVAIGALYGHGFDLVVLAEECGVLSIGVYFIWMEEGTVGRQRLNTYLHTVQTGNLYLTE
jgi:hypothetical protein